MTFYSNSHTCELFFRENQKKPKYVSTAETMHNNAVYVAVTQDFRESEKTVIWTVKHLHPKKICLLHVHIPISFTPSPSWLSENEMEAAQESEVNNAYDSLYKYRNICINNGINEEDVDTSLTSGYDVGKGIVELIKLNSIRKLVMGAAADPHYSRGMSITSTKAEYVSQHAPPSCKMWFICKGKLIKTKEASFGLVYPSDSFSEFSSSVQKPSNGKGEEELETETLQELPVKTVEPPKDFICPISLEIMQDPHIAADGFTYEAEEFRKWLRTGKQTSPTTNERLASHYLVPNRTLRSMILEWLQQHPNYIVDKY